MARIAEDELVRIKTEIPLERLVDKAGIELRAHGKNLLGRCPFHDDKTPSLVVTPEKNLWHCLGACQTGGSVIDWVMKAEGVSFRHAVELLKERYLPSLAVEPRRGRPAADGRSYPKQSSVRKLEFVQLNESDAALLQRVVDYYHEQLLQSSEALEYLKGRGLDNDKLIRRFKLGFANRTLGYRLPNKHVKAGQELRGQLQRLGVLRESGHEHLNGSLVIPVFDQAGNVSELYGRKITRTLRKGTPLHLYLPGPHRGVWNLEAIKEHKSIILCESLIDACTFWTNGLENVTTAFGVEGVTDDLWQALKAHEAERVFIAYDRDDAGDRAADKLAKELNAAGIEALRVQFPKGMDANEYAIKVQPADKSLRLAVQHAAWLGKAQPGVRKTATTEEALPTQAAKEKTHAEAPPPSPVHPAAADPTASLDDGWLDADDLNEVDRPENEAAEEEIFPLAAQGTETKETENETPASGEKISSFAAKQAPPKAERVSSRGSGEDVHVDFGDRKWRVRGLWKNQAPEQLRVNLLVRRGEAFHVDALELYSARQRAAYVKLASDELGVEERVIKRDLGQLLLQLEGLLEAERERAAKDESAVVQLSDGDRKEALELLKAPDLLERLLADFASSGVVGEETNKLVGYLAAVSRKLDEPLAVVIQSSSAAGKSSLMDAVLAFMPEEERVQYSAMTGQSLFYMGESDLKHKILAITEEEGAERAAYALKLLQSEGELTIASTGKDPQTGRLITEEYRVEGPVMIFLTTTAIEIDEELLNRCIVLSVDEGREQTRAIHELQRTARTLEGMRAKKERERIVRVHRNAQRLLRPLFVVNPYAKELRFPDHQTRMRRDHKKYLGLIDAIALLHQYQRPIKELEHRGERLKYVEVTRSDIELANQLAQEVLGRSLDELPPQTRRLLGLLDRMVTDGAEQMGVDRCDFRFSRREVRECTGWGQTQLRVHLERLVEMEYLLVHRGKQGQGYVYELTFVEDLLPMSELANNETNNDATTTAASTSRGDGGTSRGQRDNFAGSSRGDGGPSAGEDRGTDHETKPHENASIVHLKPRKQRTARRGSKTLSASYPSDVVVSSRAQGLGAE